MTNLTMGLSAGYHDASISLVNNYGDIVFAGHSERFSRIKNDKSIHYSLLAEAQKYGTIQTIAYYENVWLKKLRRLRSGQNINWSRWTTQDEVEHHLKSNHHIVDNAEKIVSFPHHKSHAAAGFQTSPYTEATVVVIDAIGEFQTATIWEAFYNRSGEAQYKLKWQLKYPNSIGLFYSAYTELVGLKPNEEEYILMGMAAYGDKLTVNKIEHAIHSDLITSINPIKFKENLHLGIDKTYAGNNFDVANAVQNITEKMILEIMHIAIVKTNSSNLVYMGGVALNCSANRLLGQYYNNIWIMPNPGDSGSSLGAAALAYKKQLNWTDAFLGYNITGEYPVQKALTALLNDDIVGVANGRAEFGPRAFGNRSLLANPTLDNIKDKVNKIKQRQEFRPFAPIILEEELQHYFEVPNGFKKSPYMQTTMHCKRPDLYPGIVHKDGTSRVQTVPKDDTGIRRLLEKYYTATGCPMLLNTSLNIKGEPLVNTKQDAIDFSRKYNVKVYTHV